jgi:hypothetical protein
MSKENNCCIQDDKCNFSVISRVWCRVFPPDKRNRW